MPFYTIVVDYAGGTYIAQFEAVDVDEALTAWAENLDVGVIADFDIDDKAELIRDLKTDQDENRSHVALNGLTNVYCTSLSVRDTHMLINVVKTVMK